MCNTTKTTFDRIKELCDQKGISIAKLASELGMSKSTFSWIKNYPNKKISLDTATKIADYFNVSVDFLMTGGEPQSKPVVTDEDLKIALFGGDGEVTDAMWEEAKEFARFIMERERKKNDDQP